MRTSDHLNDGSAVMWGELLSVLRAATERASLQDLLDEESFCLHPREDAPLLIDALSAKGALSDDDLFLVRALMDSAEPGEDYGSRYEPLSEADQETARRISYRFDARLLSLQHAAQLLGVSEQRALQYVHEGSIESFSYSGEVRVLERSVRAFLQQQSHATGRSFSRFPSRYN